jgi:hypothetical protein
LTECIENVSVPLQSVIILSASVTTLLYSL